MHSFLLLPFDMLPFQCLNGKGLVIESKGICWVPLLKNEKYNRIMFANFTVGDDGTLSGTLESWFSGYDAGIYRNQLAYPTWIVQPAFGVAVESATLTVDAAEGLLPRSRPVNLPQDVITGNSLKVIRRVEMEKGRFPASEFNTFAEFLHQISKADKSKIVLIKTTP